MSISDDLHREVHFEEYVTRMLAGWMVPGGG